jgi:hypothetical protein
VATGVLVAVAPQAPATPRAEGFRATITRPVPVTFKPTDTTIVPGRSVGGVAVDAPVTRVLEAFGRPLQTCPQPPKCLWAKRGLKYEDNGVRVDFVFRSDRTVDSIQIREFRPPGAGTRPGPLQRLRTAEGIGIGSTAGEIRKAYRRSERFGDYVENWRHIRLMTDRVATIFSFDPDRAVECFIPDTLRIVTVTLLRRV